jgi:cytochrome P450
MELIENSVKERREILLNGIFKIYLGPLPIIVVTSPEAAGHLLKRPIVIKSFLTKIFNVVFRGLVDLNEEEYKFHRKILEPAFDFQILQSLPSIVTERINEFYSMIEEAIQSNNGVINDIRMPIMRHTLKVILSSGGVEFDVEDFADNVHDDQSIDDFLTAEAFVAELMVQPWLLIGKAYLFFEFGRKANEAVERILKSGEALFEKMKKGMKSDALCNELNDSHGKMNKKKSTYMEILIRENLRNPIAFDDEAVMGEFKTFVAAGSDTVASGLIWTLYYLGHHSEVQERICEELNDVLAETDGKIETINQQPYLECVIKESLRLSPPAPFFMRDADDDIPYKMNDGNLITIPKDAPIFFIPSLVHRDPRHYIDPEDFNPDRFVNSKRRHMHSFIPFSSGVRACIGKRYALIEMMSFLSGLLRRFKIKSLNPLGSIRSNPQITNHPVGPVSLQFLPRRSYK